MGMGWDDKKMIWTEHVTKIFDWVKREKCGESCMCLSKLAFTKFTREAKLWNTNVKIFL